MNITPKIISTAGQLTALYIGASTDDKKIVAWNTLSRYQAVDQVGFLSVGDEQTKRALLTMMGGELSINGCIAAGFLLSQMIGQESVLFATSCLDDVITCTVSSQSTSADFPSRLVKSIATNAVQLEGIRYQLIAGIPREKILSEIQRKLLQGMLQADPAAGLIFYENNRIVPVVAVRDTNTVYWEQACGSGSLAYYAISGISKILQPSGEFLTISESDQSITITARTKEVIL